MSFNIIAEVKTVWNWQVLLDDETFKEFCDWFLLANLIRPVAEEAFCLEQTQLVFWGHRICRSFFLLQHILEAVYAVL